MKRILIAIAAAAALSALGAQSAVADGWYARGDVGYGFDGEVDGDDGEETFSADLDEDWMASVGIGRAFANGFRGEGEVSWRNNEIEGSTAEADVWAAMLNGYYDFHRGRRLRPYLGLGVGWANVDVGFDEGDGFAYQGLAGVAFGLTPQLDLDIGYRYFAIPDLEIAGGDVDYTHQAATIGLRWRFAPPPAPPAAAPEPAPAPVAPTPPTPPAACPQGDYVVYFEWDRSNLNAEALQVIDAAVARMSQCGASTVLLVGHADRSGSEAYNMPLSMRRAEAVRDALTARGVPAGAIRLDSRGESEPARATADGVREPLNRRTAITISFQPG